MKTKQFFKVGQYLSLHSSVTVLKCGCKDDFIVTTSKFLMTLLHLFQETSFMTFTLDGLLACIS